MRLLISAALALVAASASSLSAQPHSDRVGKASVAPEVQDRAQAQLRHQAQPQQTQQPQGGHFDRGGDRNRGPATQATIQSPANRDNRGNWQGRGDRGGAPATQATIQSPQPANRAERGNWQGRGDRGGAPATQATIQSPEPSNRGDRASGDRGNWQGRGNGNDPGYWRGNRGDWNNNRSDFNRDGRTDYRRGVTYGGPRHDFSGFRDYHRNFNVTRRFNLPYYRRPAGWYEHRWTFGEFLPAAFWARDYWLVDFQAYDLPPPPYGAVWVRVGNDALLVDEDSGEIITVAYGVFY